MSDRLRDEEKNYIEEVAIVFENTGLPRMAGRIFGWLLICDPQHQSPGEMAKALMASRGSISTMTRFLVQIGLIERIGIPGERSDYFRISPNAWQQLIKRGLEDEIRMFHQLAERGLALLADKRPQTPNWLVEMHKMHNIYNFLGREFPLLMERWEKDQKSSKMGVN